MRFLNPIVFAGLCALILTSCGDSTPTRGPMQKDVKMHANGQFASKTGYYMDDTGKAIKHGPESRYYENGNFQVRGHNKDGKSDGLWEEFYPDGSYKGIVNFNEGELDGKFTMWHPNGHLETTGQNENGLQVGEWLFYNDQGQVVKKQVFEKGELKTEEPFNPPRLDPKDVPKPTVLPKAGIVENKAIPDPKPPTPKDGKALPAPAPEKTEGAAPTGAPEPAVEKDAAPKADK